jgi:hypothetical protein
MYRVGFGDVFLLSIPADGGFEHILVDCGVHAHDLGAMPAAVAQMKADTGGKLALVIMTHRHADHISGFASQKADFAEFTVERVWMSWFEDPSDSTAFRLQSQFTAVAQHLQSALAATGDTQYTRMVGNALGAGSSNAVALQVLHSFKTAAGDPTPVDYYRAGDPANLPPALVAAGLTADILGPPTDLKLVAQMDNHAHQYLTAGDAEDSDAAPTPFDPAYDKRTFAWPKEGKSTPPWLEALYDPAQIKKHIADSMPDALAAAAQNMDDALNNQSVIALFRFKNKSMLFVGDAQWGNWANFLFGGAPAAPNPDLTDQSKAILGTLDFLKVGHHGSTNATPIDVVKALKQGCVAMCSTDPGAYGSPDKGTEVPRAPLLQALGEKTNGQLARSDQVALPGKPVDPRLGALSPVFTPGDGFIDYKF